VIHSYTSNHSFTKYAHYQQLKFVSGKAEDYSAS
jgi:hypothetical protein